ncbi:hypothetical protein NE237_032500 [Protea cynaroides]|uniref:Uncharacterized protein n=1 Tax=Protea cynaroides TaxID=273540 RepID=A0A9Q0L340_9MAGN|nr:hypothetical protein NE237_032500 [Protea cynaroides]
MKSSEAESIFVSESAQDQKKPRPLEDLSKESAEDIPEIRHEGCVSDSHWAAPVLPKPAQVTQFESSPFKLSNSNLKPCRLPAACPPNPFGCLDLDFGKIVDNSDLLEPLKPVENDPVLARSTAGHTPFRTRPSILARGKRMGQDGRSGLPKPGLGSGLVMEPRSGPDKPSPAFTILKSLSCSRGKSAASGTESRIPKTIPTPTLELIQEDFVDETAVRSLPPWEDDVLISHHPDGLNVMDSPTPKTILTDLGLDSNGKGKWLGKAGIWPTKISDQWIFSIGM